MGPRNRAAAALLSLLLLGCHSPQDGPRSDAGSGVAPSRASVPVQAVAARASAPDPSFREQMRGRTLGNRFAYIPPQCYVRTRDERGEVHNACYACHVHSEPPDYADDALLQLTLKLPPRAAKNPWLNLFDPPGARAARRSDEATLGYVRTSNYFTERGDIALAEALGSLPADWDARGDGQWDGFVPDAWYRFDERGFDRGPDGARTGWRALAYAPFLGAFFPTNGSADDVLVRLDPSLREDAAGRADPRIYEVNLAVVEALIGRADVPIDPTDERPLGVDLDLDGKLGRAVRVSYDGALGAAGTTRMHYVGRARLEERAGRLPIAPGLFPLGTEFLHSVRYLDLGPDGVVAMAARMKELRYAKKVRWFSDDALKREAALEPLEQSESPDRAVRVLSELDRGIYNKQGWLFQGFIEDRDGALRPQTYEETAYCAGCHGGIGATTDSIFSFSRKLRAGVPAGGWFHWTQHDLRGIPEPRRRDGEYEYTLYLRANGAGDDLRENGEVLARFFDEAGGLRADRVAELHEDVATLLLPSAARALDLDRAYWAAARDQSFTRGRDALLAPARNVYASAPVNEGTGVSAPLAGPRAGLPAIH